MDKEILRLKVESLVALRTSIINTLIVLVGGLASLCFLHNSPLKFFLLLAGGFYLTIFVSNLDNTMQEIDKLINSKGE